MVANILIGIFVFSFFLSSTQTLSMPVYQHIARRTHTRAMHLNAAEYMLREVFQCDVVPFDARLCACDCLRVCAPSRPTFKYRRLSSRCTHMYTYLAAVLLPTHLHVCMPAMHVCVPLCLYFSLHVFTCTVSLSLCGVPCLFLYAHCLLSVFRVEREFSGVLCVHIAHRVFSTISSIVYRIIEYRSSACVPRLNNNNNNLTRGTVNDREQSWYFPQISLRRKKRAHCQLFFSISARDLLLSDLWNSA